MKPAESYDAMCAQQRWRIPDHFNMGVAVCDKQKQRDVALIHPLPDNEVREYTFGDLKRLSNRLANLLVAKGINRGDRVGILLPQTPETATAHVAIYKAGMVAMPLFVLFGADALEYRLADSGARALITDRENAAKLVGIRDRLPNLEVVLSIDGPGEDGAGGALDFHGELAKVSDKFDPVDTLAEEPGLLIYTSGTTGPPKGALHAHRVLIGHMPGVEMIFDFFPQPGDVAWTPADWAWIGGLYDVLMPALYRGVPQVINPPGKFDAEAAFELIARFGINVAFIPPTGLKMMRQIANPRDRWNYSLRTVFSGGEALGNELMGWGRDALGVIINEAYGQTECNVIVGCCGGIMTPPPGSMGRASPGHDLKILDENGVEVPRGELGSICCKAPDPVMFLEYWNQPEATRNKFVTDANGDEWLVTGDTAKQDADGWIFFIGRDDDVITSSGYRIGPAEVEDCLFAHPAVALSAVIGVPDPERTERVKAFIILNEGFEGSDELAREIQTHVRTRLAAHEYPREVEFVTELPMTTTGKIQRKVLREMEVAKQAAE
ncbi:MAG: AMP-binding protein [Alphaproteobacteria bacterium]|nr:AMP-binding protein [Alphaproteobacteria bacterium]